MAFPTIPTGGRVLSRVQADASTTRTFPDLSSLTKGNNDLLIAIIVAYQSASPATAHNAFSGWGGGFTEFVDRMTTPGSTMAIGVAYKRSTGSETGTFTVTQAAAVTGHAAMFLLSIPGAHITTAPEGGGIVDGTAAAANIAALNPAGWDAEDTLWIAVGASGETSTSGAYDGLSAAPANYTDLAQTGNSGDVLGAVEGGVAFRQLNAASEDPATFTVDLSAERNSALLLAVRPIAPIDAGVASEGDSAPKGEAVIGPAVRHFEGAATGDLRTDPTPLATLNQGAFSYAALMRMDPASAYTALALVNVASGASTGYMYVLQSGVPNIQIKDGAGAANNVTPPTLKVPMNEWVILGVSKASGVATPRFHLWTKSGGWTHEDASATLGNAVESATIAEHAYTGFIWTKGEKAITAAWAAALSDAAFAALSTNFRTSDWLGHSTPPVAAWLFNQPSTADPVQDATNGGSDQSYLTGTSVVPHGPINGSGTPFTFGQSISAGVASEADAALGGSLPQPQLVEAGVASETDASLGGSIAQPQPPVAGGLGAEADAGLAGSIVQPQSPLAGEVAFEADAAPAGQIASMPQTVEGGVAGEADTSLGGTITQPQAPVAGGVGAEADAGLAGALIQPQPPVAGQPAAEADAALAGAMLQAQPPLAAGTAGETDAGLAGSIRQPQAVAGGLASEADAGLAGSITQPQAPVVGLAAPETDSAPVGSVRQIGGVASEADAAIGGAPVVGSMQVVQAGVAVEVDAAPSGVVVNPQAPLAGGRASEADAAIAGLVGQAQRISAAAAAEVDRAPDGVVGQAQLYLAAIGAETDGAPVGTPIVVPLVWTARMRTFERTDRAVSSETGPRARVSERLP
ncbi:MAG TPA: hypothetical protein VIU37_12665 [Candidatus Limnocylindrales bacterium]